MSERPCNITNILRTIHPDAELTGFVIVARYQKPNEEEPTLHMFWMKNMEETTDSLLFDAQFIAEWEDFEEHL